MNQNKEVVEIALTDQALKFSSQSMLGFQAILLFGLGKRLGIFDYLYKKGKSSIDKNEFPSVTFTIDELSKESNGLSGNYRKN